MSWFNKKEEQKETFNSLPKLPKLPELPQIKKEDKITQLPIFPNNSIGQKFSQNNIKEAIDGRKEIYEKESFLPKLDEIEKTNQEIGKNLHFPSLKDSERKIKEFSEEFEDIEKEINQNKPLFIRIDKFKESVNNLKEIKNQILEIEKMLKEIKQIKKEEEEELEDWEEKLKTIKIKLEGIDKNLFSKLQ
jgi:hypothetical protein